MNWGYHIKKLREEANLTQQQLADKAGMKRSHISNIERGSYKTYKEEILNRLAYALGITTKELIDEIYVKDKESYKTIETPEQILEHFRIAMPATIPIYEDFPFHAGTPVEPAGYIAMIKNRARGIMLEAYIVQGQCLEPEVKEGDIIVVNREGQIDNGDIVACLVDDMLHLARLRKIADVCYLENNNGRMKLEEVQMAAPVIEVRRRLK